MFTVYRFKLSNLGSADISIGSQEAVICRYLAGLQGLMPIRAIYAADREV